MADQIVTTTTSAQGSLNVKDLLKGLLMAVISAVLTTVYTSISTGSLDFNWKAIGLVASGTAVSYLLKNWLTPSQTVITPPPGTGEVTVKIPKPGETIKQEVKV